jgi:hypothetical protein
VAAAQGSCPSAAHGHWLARLDMIWSVNCATAGAKAGLPDAIHCTTQETTARNNGKAPHYSHYQGERCRGLAMGASIGSCIRRKSDRPDLKIGGSPHFDQWHIHSMSPTNSEMQWPLGQTFFTVRSVCLSRPPRSPCLCDIVHQRRLPGLPIPVAPTEKVLLQPAHAASIGQRQRQLHARVAEEQMPIWPEEGGGQLRQHSVSWNKRPPW